MCIWLQSFSNVLHTPNSHNNKTTDMFVRVVISSQCNGLQGNLAPGLDVDVTLTCTTQLNIIGAKLHPIPWQCHTPTVGSPRRIMCPTNTTITIQGWLEEQRAQSSDLASKALDTNPIKRSWMQRNRHPSSHPPKTPHQKNKTKTKDLLPISCQETPDIVRGLTS